MNFTFTLSNNPKNYMTSQNDHDLHEFHNILWHYHNNHLATHTAHDLNEVHI